MRPSSSTSWPPRISGARSIAEYVENSKIKCAKKAANAASPFTRLNDLLALGTLRVSLHNPDDVEIVARKGSGPTFGIEKMSDGERNAVIIAATVLTVDPGTTLLIDEPERHLHRAIIAPFLSVLFEQRQDCAFVVSTHELFLPVENPGARVLMTRSCTWAGDNPQAWDLEILAQSAELPEELRLAVLGARSRVLFVEGSSTSLDLPLYDTLFPELSVSPCGNCVDVERAVRGLRATEDRHHVETYGIVDRDDLDDAAVDKLAEAGIFALAVRSVESLYYCSDAMQAVARHQADSIGLDAENLAGSAKRDALAPVRAAHARHRPQPATGLEDHPVGDRPDHRPARPVRLRRRGRPVPAPPGRRRLRCARRTVSVARDQGFWCDHQGAQVRLDSRLRADGRGAHRQGRRVGDRPHESPPPIGGGDHPRHGQVVATAADRVRGLGPRPDASANPARPGESCVAPPLHGISCCGRTAGPGPGAAPVMREMPQMQD